MIYFLLFSLATRTISLHRLAGSLGKSALVFVAVSRDAGSLCNTAGTCRPRDLSNTRYGDADDERVSFSVDAIALLCHAIFVDLDDAFAYRQETHKSGPGLET